MTRVQSRLTTRRASLSQSRCWATSGQAQMNTFWSSWMFPVDSEVCLLFPVEPVEPRRGPRLPSCHPKSTTAVQSRLTRTVAFSTRLAPMAVDSSLSSRTLTATPGPATKSTTGPTFQSRLTRTAACSMTRVQSRLATRRASLSQSWAATSGPAQMNTFGSSWTLPVDACSLSQVEPI